MTSLYKEGRVPCCRVHMSAVTSQPYSYYPVNMAPPSWTRVAQASELQRSSHILSVVDDTVFVYRGELLPRQPRDGQVYALDVNGS